MRSRLTSYHGGGGISETSSIRRQSAKIRMTKQRRTGPFALPFHSKEVSYPSLYNSVSAANLYFMLDSFIIRDFGYDCSQSAGSKTAQILPTTVVGLFVLLRIRINRFLDVHASYGYCSIHHRLRIWPPEHHHLYFSNTFHFFFIFFSSIIRWIKAGTSSALMASFVAKYNCSLIQ